MKDSLAIYYAKSALKLLGFCVLIILAVFGAEDVFRFLAKAQADVPVMAPYHADLESNSEYDPTGVGEVE